MKTFSERCSLDHPYHTLYQILALSNAFKDDNGSTSSKHSSLPPRVVGAQDLLRKLKKVPRISAIVSQIEKMCDVLIDLANKETGSSQTLSINDPLLKLKNLHLVHCPTIKLPVSISGDYSNITYISKWKNTIGSVGGINAPKRLECLCSDGNYRPQLLKGKDDLRQDAVMQQVFTILNELLAGSKKTKRDRLHVRTYIVVPLSQRSGILEWCENTIPLAEYLTGNRSVPGAHVRYHPKDMPPTECRQKLLASVFSYNNTYIYLVLVFSILFTPGKRWLGFKRMQ